MPNVSSICQKHKGLQTWGFSQGKITVFLHYYFKSKTFGICAALSAHWIKHHAHGGSLVNVLGGGGQGSLNVGKLHQIARLHANVSDGNNQAGNLEKWLMMNDVTPLRGSRIFSHHRLHHGWRAESWSKGKIRPGTANTPSIPDIAGDIVKEMKKYSSCYARVNFGGKWGWWGAGHAVAVWLGQPTYNSNGDAMLFDPNHGEFWFEDKKDFFAFFPEYYRVAYLSGKYHFDKSWEVLPCAKRAL